MKIYVDDPHVPYKSTEINAQRTKAQIDGLLAEWGIRDYAWHWDPENADVFVEFQFSETIGGISVKPVIRVSALIVWNSGSSRKEESINWDVTMRLVFWFIKTHLEAAYLSQSSRTEAFLPYIQSGEGGQNLAKVVIKNLERIQSMPALAAPKPERIIVEDQR